jgi:hypothetical protein
MCYIINEYLLEYSLYTICAVYLNVQRIRVKLNIIVSLNIYNHSPAHIFLVKTKICAYT